MQWWFNMDAENNFIIIVLAGKWPQTYQKPYLETTETAVDTLGCASSVGKTNSLAPA